MRLKIFRPIILLAVLLTGFLAWRAYAGQEFRSFDSFATPYDTSKQIDVTQEGYQAVSAVKRVPQDVTEKVVRELFAAWNTPQLPRKLSKDFPNKTRILDSINTSVPKYLELQILSIQNARTVEQYVRPHPSGDGSYQLLSKVAVSVRSQVADSAGAVRNFQRTEGTSEYLISIVQKVKNA